MIAAVLVFAAAVAARWGFVAARRASVRNRLVAADRRAVQPIRWSPLEQLLVKADVAPPVAARYVPVLAGAVGVSVVVAGPAFAVVVLLAGVGAPLVWVSLHRDRLERRIEHLLPDALEAIARALRAGGSLLQAVEVAAASLPPPLGADLAEVATRARHDEGLVSALERWAETRPLPGVRLAVAALALGAETGGAQARAVDGVAATLRQRLATAAELRALSSQARMSAAVIAVAPLGFGVFASAADGRTASFLLGTPFGLACLAGGLLLDGVAAVWMHALTRSPQP